MHAALVLAAVRCCPRPRLPHYRLGNAPLRVFERAVDNDLLGEWKHVSSNDRTPPPMQSSFTFMADETGVLATKQKGGTPPLKLDFYPQPRRLNSRLDRTAGLSDGLGCRLHAALTGGLHHHRMATSCRLPQIQIVRRCHMQGIQFYLNPFIELKPNTEP